MHTEDFKQGSVGASRCYVKKLPVGDGCGARFRGLGWPSWAAVVWTRVSVIPGTWQTLACSELYRGENRGEEVCSLGTIGLSPGKEGASGEGAAREGEHWGVLEKGDTDTSCERHWGPRAAGGQVCVRVCGPQDEMRMVLPVTCQSQQSCEGDMGRRGTVELDLSSE